MIKRTALLLVTTLGLLNTHAASAKKVVDPFAEFRGSFSGSASFVIAPGSPTFTGTGTLKVTGPKKGKSAILSFSGTVSNGVTTYAYSNTITFSKKGAFSVAEGVFKLGGGSSASSFSGQATVRKTLISGKGAFTINDNPAIAIFSMQAKTSGKTRTLTINYTAEDANGTYPFQFVVTGKVKK